MLIFFNQRIIGMFLLLYLVNITLCRATGAIETAKLSANHKFYVTLSEGSRLERWQNYTGNLLTRYEVAEKQVLDFFIWENENQLLVLNSDQIIVLDIYSGQEIKSLNLVSKLPKVLSPKDGRVAFQIDHGHLAISTNKSLDLYDLYQGKHRLSLKSHNQARHLGFINSGNALVGVDMNEKVVFSLNIKRQKIDNIQGASIKTRISYRSDGARFLIKQFSQWRLYNEDLDLVKSGRFTLAFTDSQIEFVGNSDFVVYAGTDGYFNLTQLIEGWNLLSQFELNTDQFDLNSIHLLAYKGVNIEVRDFDGNLFFVTEHFRFKSEKPATADFRIKADSIVQAQNGVEFIHEAPVTTFLIHGEKLITGDLFGRVCFWSLDGKLLSKVNALGHAITALQPLSKEAVLAASIGRATEVRLSGDMTPLLVRGHKAAINTIAVSKNGKYLAVASDDRSISIWDYTSRRFVKKIKLDHIPHLIGFNEDNSLSYQKGLSDVQLIIDNSWLQSYSSKEQAVVTGSSHNTAIRDIEFSPDGSSIISSDLNKVVKVWDVATMYSKKTYKHGSDAGGVLWTKSGSEFIRFAYDSIYIHDAISGNKISISRIPKFYQTIVQVRDMAVDKGNNYAVVISRDNHGLYMFHMNSGHFYPIVSTGHKYQILALAIHPDGEYIATLGTEQIEFRKMNDFSLVGSIKYKAKHNRSLYGEIKLEYSPDGKYIATNIDNRLLVWECESGQIVFDSNSCIDFAFTGNSSIVRIDQVSDFQQEYLINRDIVSDSVIFAIQHKVEEVSYQRLDYNSLNGLIALGDSKGQLTLMDANSGELLNNLRLRSNTEARGTMNPKTGELLFGIPGALLFLDLKSLSVTRRISSHHNYWKMVPNADYVNNDNLLIESHYYSTNILDSKTFEVLYRLRGANRKKVSANGQLIGMLIGLGDTLEVYNILTGEIKAVISPPDQSKIIRDFDFSPDNSSVLLLTTKRKTFSKQISPDYSDLKEDNFLDYYSFSDADYNEGGALNFFHSATLQVSNDGKWIAVQSDYNKVRLIKAENSVVNDIYDAQNLEYMDFSPLSEHLIWGTADGKLKFKSLENGDTEFTLDGHSDVVNKIVYYDQNMYSFSDDGTIIAWDFSAKNKVAQISTFQGGQYVIVDADNNYAGTKGIVNGVYFRKGNEVTPFEQYDLMLNRPDILAGKFGAPESLKSLYYEAYKKRLKRMGFGSENMDVFNSEPPQLFLTRDNQMVKTSSDSVTFEIEAIDSVANLNRINVWINGVPIYGALGLSLNEKELNNFSRKISCRLSQGINKIQVSVHNDLGLESNKETFYISRIQPENRKPNLYFIALSVTDYQDNDYDLTFARKDGEDLARLFKDSGSFYNEVKVKTLFDSSFTRSKVQELKDWLMKSNVDDQVILFVSGHGVLDKFNNYFIAGFDMDFDNPAKKGIPYTALEDLIDGIPARKKLLLIDACHSGELDKESTKPATEKGGGVTVSPGSKGAKSKAINDAAKTPFELMLELFVDLDRGNGAEVIAASTGDGYAWEDYKWKNGAFTYSIKEALSLTEEYEYPADWDENGTVTVDELIRYLMVNVPILTKGKQRPTSRRNNVEIDFAIRN